MSEGGEKEDADGGATFPKSIGIFLVVLAVSTLLQSAYFQYQQSEQTKESRKRTDCQAGVNALLIDALEARGGSANEASEKMIEMLRSIRDAKGPDDTRGAINAYIAVLEKQKTARTQNPYPAIPNNCR